MSQAKDIMNELIRKAKEIVPEVIVEEHRLPEFDAVRLAKGGCKTDFRHWLGMTVYYVDEVQGVACLAHEVGHLMTTNLPKYKLEPLKYEKKASEWGLLYLADKLSRNELVACARIMNIWLNSYYSFYHVDELRREYISVPVKQEVLQ